MAGLLVDLDRLGRATDLLARAGIDAMLISPGPDLRYLCGYDALPLERLTCLVLRPDHSPMLVVPTLERPAAEVSPIGAADVEILGWNETDDPYALVGSLLGSVDRVAVDDHMWAEKVLAFRSIMAGTEQVLAGSVLRELRMRKSPAEVAALAQAGAAIDRVHADMHQWLRAGRTEREVGADIADAILAAGHDIVDFVIVGSGPNGASPHHELSDRVIQRGDPVVVDLGGTTPLGYCSDSTRTYSIGVPPQRFLDSYEVLMQAQDAACRHVKPGVSAESVDRVARQVITEAGHGELFIHRTGHGIGLSTHEEPYIVEGNALILEPGMAFSIEPGLYHPREFGARIEDIVICTSEGVQSVNHRPHELVVLDH